MATLLRVLIQLPSTLLIFAVRCYQVFISPVFPPMCRFKPTCSTYFIEAVKKYGAIRGSLKGLWRICRCHPFNPGGYDPP
jgi:putative membrane protein insertion efficiency factor